MLIVDRISKSIVYQGTFNSARFLVGGSHDSSLSAKKTPGNPIARFFSLFVTKLFNFFRTLTGNAPRSTPTIDKPPIAAVHVAPTTSMPSATPSKDSKPFVVSDSDKKYAANKLKEIESSMQRVAALKEAVPPPEDVVRSVSHAMRSISDLSDDCLVGKRYAFT